MGINMASNERFQIENLWGYLNTCFQDYPENIFPNENINMEGIPFLLKNEESSDEN